MPTKKRVSKKGKSTKALDKNEEFKESDVKKKDMNFSDFVIEDGKKNDDVVEKVDGKIVESEKPGGDVEIKHNREFYWVIGVMAAMIVVLIVASVVFQSLNKFEHDGLTFEKERFGEIPIYHYSYFPSNPYTGEVIGKYNLYLRIDPRKNNVPMEGVVQFPFGKFVYVSVNGTGLTECEFGRVAIGNLAGFLTDHDITVKGASPDKEQAELANAKHITCEDKPENVKILIQSGNETRIYKDVNLCHIIEIADCEVLDAIEKFQTQTIINAKERAGL
jgi:hypothetical protein